MSRSLKKGPYVDEKLFIKATNAKSRSIRTPIKTWARASMIVPEFVGLTFAVHDGKKHVPVFVTESMVGHRLGEFAPSRLFRQHGGIRTKKSEAKK